MKPRAIRTLLCLLVPLLLAPDVGAEQAMMPSKEKLHVYLVTGGAAMAVADGEGEPIPRCYLLNAQGMWEPAMGSLNRYSSIADGPSAGKVGPARGFVEAMLAADPELEIGLVVNAAENVAPQEWHMKSRYYRGARKRTLQAMKTGTLMGVLWHGGGSLNPLLTDIDHLKTLIADLRSDLRMLNLPVIVGEIPGDDALNMQMSQVAKDVHACGVVGVGGLSLNQKGRLDAAAMQAFGDRYAVAMMAIQKDWRGKIGRSLAPRMPVIDAHIHAMSNKPGGLDPVIAWMDRHGVERCISSPIGDSRARTPEQRKVMLENFAKYEGRIERMALIEPGEVQTVAEAVAILEKEKAEGAIAFGEHYGRELMFDDPKNLLLYEACEKVGLPVMFHIDASKNMVEQGMRRVERVLDMFPDCKIIAHAYWWLQFPDGTCDRMMRKYPNLYADVSGLRMVGMLNRDRGQTREFLLRHADRVLFCTDAGWWSFGSRVDNRELQFSLLEELDLPDEVLRKIYRDNAMRLFGLKELPKESFHRPHQQNVHEALVHFGNLPKPACCAGD